MASSSSTIRSLGLAVIGAELGADARGLGVGLEGGRLEFDAQFASTLVWGQDA